MSKYCVHQAKLSWICNFPGCNKNWRWVSPNIANIKIFRGQKNKCDLRMLVRTELNGNAPDSLTIFRIDPLRCNRCKKNSARVSQKWLNFIQIGRIKTEHREEPRLAKEKLSWHRETGRQAPRQKRQIMFAREFGRREFPSKKHVPTGLTDEFRFLRTILKQKGLRASHDRVNLQHSKVMVVVKEQTWGHKVKFISSLSFSTIRLETLLSSIPMN